MTSNSIDAAHLFLDRAKTRVVKRIGPLPPKARPAPPNPAIPILDPAPLNGGLAGQARQQCLFFYDKSTGLARPAPAQLAKARGIISLCFKQVTELPFLATKVFLGRSGAEDVFQFGPLNEYERKRSTTARRTGQDARHVDTTKHRRCESQRRDNRRRGGESRRARHQRGGESSGTDSATKLREDEVSVFRSRVKEAKGGDARDFTITTTTTMFATNVVVLDNNDGLIKASFGGERDPAAILPNCLYRSPASKKWLHAHSLPTTTSTNSTASEPDLTSNAVRRPFDRGYLINSDLQRE
ncbi:Actin- protein 6 [Stylosanthes scabra]|uniref:Actin- protein 6 n=1 Tax=Stylosanthes scabra TaxID=79078 RepID=A0ABU6ZH65_9FABA|nr:Actin- protein 6 [Stylosanthes scabra]